MNPIDIEAVSVLPALAALLVALLTAGALAPKSNFPPASERFDSLDGLRGFLAVLVFLDHSCIWYFYLRTGRWENPPSAMYTHFGESSVALFFMITGFLFTSKLINGRARAINWEMLFVSRIMRLVPLYAAAVCVMFALVLYLSHGSLREPATRLLAGMLKWLLFTVFGGPNLNGVERTFVLTAGVTWSLPYEWLFYFSLPVLSLVIGRKPPTIYLIVGALCIGFAASKPSIHYLSFAGGIFAAFAARSKAVQRVSVSHAATFVACICLAMIMTLYPSGIQVGSLVLLTVFFVAVSSGNDLFGLLRLRASRALGEFAYGIYLLHGLLLFILMNIALDPTHARTLSALEHWGIVIGITPALIGLCFLAFRFIEYPAMQRTTDITNWIHSQDIARILLDRRR